MYNLNWRRLRKYHEVNNHTEQQVREYHYKHNDVPNPDEPFENLLRMVFHPTDEELKLEDEALSQFSLKELALDEYLSL